MQPRLPELRLEQLRQEHTEQLLESASEHTCKAELCHNAG